MSHESCQSHGGSCSSGHSGHSSCSCGGQSCKGQCGCGCKDCKCNEGSCQEDFAKKLIEMADCAWMEIVKEKIKAHILSSSGEHLDKLAEIVSEANKLRWQEKMAAKQGCNDFKEKLSEFFNCKGQCNK